jgi:large subunit ribosomal protein LP2
MIEAVAYLLCKLGGKDGSDEEIKAVITAAGHTVNEEQISKLLADLEGKDISTVLSAGQEKIKSVAFGGGGGGGGGGGAAAAAGGAAPAVEEKEEEKEEEEMDLAGGMDMFGGDAGGGGGDY